jgi:iron complex transport system substrate-binding protein
MSPRWQGGGAALDRRRFVLAAAATAVVASRPALARQDATPAADVGADGAWTFTDDAGVTIEREQRPERIVAYLPLAASLWEFGIRPVGVYGTTRRADGSPEVYAGEVDLDAVESLGEVYGELDLEALVGLQPDLIVNDMWADPPDVWGLTPETVQQVTQIAPIANIRFVERPAPETIASIEALAAALGADLTAPEIVVAKADFEETSEALRAAIAEKPWLTALFVSATPEGSFWVASPEEFSDLMYFRDLGLDIVVPETITAEWWEELSWEQAAKYPADLILVDARSGSSSAEDLMAVPTFAALPAAAAGQTAPWQTEYVPSYAAFTAVVRDLAEAIRGVEEDVV